MSKLRVAASPRVERPEIELTTTPYIWEVAHYLCPPRQWLRSVHKWN